MREWEAVERPTTEQRLVQVICDRCASACEQFAGQRDTKGGVEGLGPGGARSRVFPPLTFIYMQLDFGNEMARHTEATGVIDAQLCSRCIGDLLAWVADTKAPDAPGIVEGYVELMGS